MKFTALVALIATASAIKIGDPKYDKLPSQVRTAGRVSATGNTWNYKTTGGHTGVFSLPLAAPKVASYALGGDGTNKTGGLNQP